MNKRESFRKYQQRGFTLLELGIVVTIALVLIGVGVTKVPKIMADNRANAEISELPQIVANIQKAVANQQNYTGMTLDSLIRLDVFPQNRVTIPAAGAATATNRWGGIIGFTMTTTVTVNDTGILIYHNVPSSECKSVISAAGPTFLTIYADPTDSGATYAGTVVKPTGVPVDSVALTTGCSGVSNTISFGFGK